MAKITIEITEQELKDLKKVRNYFGEHDVTIFEHFAYSFLDNLYKKMCVGETSNENSALPIPDVSAMLPSDIEKLIRFTIRQWSSLKELQEPDHDSLVNRWFNGDLKDWIKSNLR